MAIQKQTKIITAFDSKKFYLEHDSSSGEVALHHNEDHMCLFIENIEYVRELNEILTKFLISYDGDKEVVSSL